jgi:hypothetical protein
MKKSFTLCILLTFCGTTCNFAQTVSVWSLGIIKTSVNVRGNPVVLGQLTISAPSAGKVVVHFNGDCTPSTGDRIVLAASNLADWGINDGNVSVYNKDASFSHTRVYNVTSGSHTYYAVAQNYVNQAGTGLASIYGNLTVEFFPTGSTTFVSSTGIVKTSINVRGNPVVVGQVTINASSAGKVIVHFDGDCTPNAGDRIVLAASDQADWGANDGNVSIYNTDASFSHSRVYNVTAGSHTYYAVAQNYVNQAGSGLASIYGNLTVEFFPTGSNTFVSSTGIVKTSINVRGNPVVVGQLTINAPTTGKVLVHFDGDCSPSTGDRIVLAASNLADWGINDGNVSIYNTDASFSHTRVYNATAGSHTYYAVAENYVNQAGTGLASIYGNLTVAFFSDFSTAVENIIDENTVLVYPNPAKDILNIEFSNFKNANAEIITSEGRSVQNFSLKDLKTQIDIGNLPDGIYFVKISSNKGLFVKKLIKQ